MAITLINKHSETPDAVPATTELLVGEIAVNTADKKWFTKTTAGDIVCLNHLTVLDGGEVSMPAAFYSPNTAWTAVGFTGSGVVSSKYQKATISVGAADGMAIRTSAAGTVYITAATVGTDAEFLIAKSPDGITWTVVSSLGDYNGYFASNFSLSFAVTAGMHVAIAYNYYSGGTFFEPNAAFTDLAVWWTA